MREIKFRGFTKYGKVKYGCYCNRSFTVILTSEKDSSGLIKHEAIEVLPETVGQFTGLKDKNGKEIYEGDKFNIEGKIYQVEWMEDYGGFILTTGKGYDSKNMIDFNCDSVFTEIIIGNTHTK